MDRARRVRAAASLAGFDWLHHSQQPRPGWLQRGQARRSPYRFSSSTRQIIINPAASRGATRPRRGPINHAARSGAARGRRARACAGGASALAHGPGAVSLLGRRPWRVRTLSRGCAARPWAPRRRRCSRRRRRRTRRARGPALRRAQLGVSACRGAAQRGSAGGSGCREGAGYCNHACVHACVRACIVHGHLPGPVKVLAGAASPATATLGTMAPSL